ncbi:hypothetical protein [Lysobacter sp. Root916]|uniref:hypothetical protein n=1 Tax=Lysobacter sp. Root916 TaxID=1736606 RepID=UPI001910E141|nr:hypothetical protein [Lysobacter sp. Root916]
MKTVFTLAEELRRNPERVAIAQALTMDASKPLMGLKGTYGFFGSEAWWRGIEERRTPLRYEAGKISRAYCGGQDRSEINNTVDLVTSDDRVIRVGIFTNDEQDIALFREGSWVEVVHALDELKRPARDSSINHVEITLEMAVSFRPID